MSSENNLKKFFQNFLAYEKEKENVSDEYLIFLKIIWNSYDEIVFKSKTLRKIFILEQLEKYLTNDLFKEKIGSIVLPDKDEISISKNDSTPNITLDKIDLVNFRGFQANEDNSGRKLEFNEKATLIYSPNGGGKTSLCEALEWALTGDSYERKKRKVEPVGLYFQNNEINEPKYTTTKLYLTDQDIELPNLTFDRCFLEKNRIEEFAKLAIQPSNDFQKVLGELFGFSEVVDFFKEFGQDLSPTDNEKNKNERVNWRIWLDWNSRKNENEKELENAKNEEKKSEEALREITGEKNYIDKKEEIESQGKKLREELDALEKDYSSSFSAVDFTDKINKYLSKINIWRKLTKDINKHAKELDFEKLFQSANNLFQTYSDSKCPLCDTPYEQSGRIFKRAGVKTNPRKKIKKELKKLEKLTEWKKDLLKIEIELKGAIFREIRNLWEKVQNNLKDDNWNNIAGSVEKSNLPELNFIELESYLEGSPSDFLSKCESAFTPDFSELTILETAIENYQKAREKKIKDKANKETKIEQLRNKFAKLQESKNGLSAKQQIKKSIEEKLRHIINQANNSEKFKKILDIYSEFYDSIKLFYSESILKEASDIDEYVSGFYRALNLYDHDGEKVKKICFPKSIQDKFCVKYEKNENKVCDALNLFSEGHLKTLGLSSLLARAIKYSVPVIVFDDVINAIDSDHRDNIAFLLANKFTDENGIASFGEKWGTVKNYLNNCQFVITSHDRFFDEKISNFFDKDYQTRYVLYSGKNGIDFCEKGNPANFEAKIEKFLNPETQDVRSAIFYCRIWLEELLLHIVSNFKNQNSKKGIIFNNTRIDTKTKQIRNPALEIIIESLISNLKKDGTTNDEKEITAILEEMYKEKESSLVWFFNILNQESHHRRYDHVNISNAPTSVEVRNVFNKIQEVNNFKA